MSNFSLSPKAKENVLKLIQADRSFALYRLPGEPEIGLVLQNEGEPEQFFSIDSIKDMEGFVIAPFAEKPSHPILVIAPDVAVRGEEVNQALESVEIDDDEIFEDDFESEDEEESPEEQREKYKRAFARFMAPLKEGKFEKLVLSRSASFDLKEGFSASEAFLQACERFPTMMVYLLHTPVSGTWTAVTPEILLKRVGEEYETVALAGTMAVAPGEPVPEWSEKNCREQAHVADYIRDVIAEHGELISESEPFTAQAGRLVHLKTEFKFRLKARSRIVSVVEALHPTPAVCGLPKQECFEFILENEGYDRTYYTGFVGPLSLNGRSDLYVNLRCAKLMGNKAVLYAGGGLLVHSEEASEWVETVEKMKTVKSILEA